MRRDSRSQTARAVLTAATFVALAPSSALACGNAMFVRDQVLIVSGPVVAGMYALALVLTGVGLAGLFNTKKLVQRFGGATSNGERQSLSFLVVMFFGSLAVYGGVFAMIPTQPPTILALPSTLAVFTALGALLGSVSAALAAVGALIFARRGALARRFALGAALLALNVAFGAAQIDLYTSSWRAPNEPAEVNF